jgi:methionyl-tRNA formyltransferase
VGAVSGGVGRFHSLQRAAEAHHIPYQGIGNPNLPEFVDALRVRAPDVVISVACPYILKAATLSIPTKGCINIHHASLPKYKGMMPTFWQLFHGEKTVGITVHTMAVRVDEGEALLQEELTINPRETLDVLIRRSKRHGAHCVAKVLRQIKSDTVAPRPLNSAEGSYFTFPTYAEIREFHRRGNRAI